MFLAILLVFLVILSSGTAFYFRDSLKSKLDSLIKSKKIVEVKLPEPEPESTIGPTLVLKMEGIQKSEEYDIKINGKSVKSGVLTEPVEFTSSDTKQGDILSIDFKNDNGERDIVITEFVLNGDNLLDNFVLDNGSSFSKPWEQNHADVILKDSTLYWGGSYSFKIPKEGEEKTVAEVKLPEPEPESTIGPTLVLKMRGNRKEEKYDIKINGKSVKSGVLTEPIEFTSSETKKGDILSIDVRNASGARDIYITEFIFNGDDLLDNFVLDNGYYFSKPWTSEHQGTVQKSKLAWDGSYSFKI